MYGSSPDSGEADIPDGVYPFLKYVVGMPLLLGFIVLFIDLLVWLFS